MKQQEDEADSLNNAEMLPRVRRLLAAWLSSALFSFNCPGLFGKVEV